MRELHARYRARHREELRERDRAYKRRSIRKPKPLDGFSQREKNRIYAQRWRARNANDPAFFLGRRLRERVRNAVKMSGTKKCAKTMELLGCTLPQFRVHIASLFLPGMSFDNRHQWHIDHRKPVALFDLSDEQQQRECFHYTNLQPLWSEDNRRKSDRYDENTPQRKVSALSRSQTLRALVTRRRKPRPVRTASDTREFQEIFRNPPA